MGGMLATRFTLMYPDRVSALILVNPIGLEDWKRVVPYPTIDETTARERTQTAEKIREYFRIAYFGGEWKPEYEPLLGTQTALFTGPGRDVAARVSALTLDMIFTQPVVYEFPDLRVATLLVIGQRDRTAIGGGRSEAKSPESRLGDYPRLGRAARAAIPGAELVELDGVGHIPFVENFPRTRDALLEFLSAQSPLRPSG
jgi:pimeloyl-ACP methyl ester carboxylesterase